MPSTHRHEHWAVQLKHITCKCKYREETDKQVKHTYCLHTHLLHTYCLYAHLLYTHTHLVAYDVNLSSNKTITEKKDWPILFSCISNKSPTQIVNESTNFSHFSRKAEADAKLRTYLLGGGRGSKVRYSSAEKQKRCYETLRVLFHGHTVNDIPWRLTEILSEVGQLRVNELVFNQTIIITPIFGILSNVQICIRVILQTVWHVV